MNAHMKQAQALADKITTKAEDALASLDREMTIMEWQPEYRAIMWETVAAVAAQRAELARQS